MAFIDLFKPKWKHSDPDVRLAAVKKLTNLAIIAKIARHDDNNRVHAASVEKITDQTILSDIAKYHFGTLNTAAIKKITNQALIADIAMNAISDEYRKAAVEKLKDQTILAGIALNDKYNEVRKVAVQKLTDQEVISNIAMNDYDEYVGEAAVKNINLTDQNVLEFIATKGKHHPRVCAAAASKVKDELVLGQIIGFRCQEGGNLVFFSGGTQNRHLDVRCAAVRALSDQAKLAQIAKRIDLYLVGWDGYTTHSEDPDLCSTALNCLTDQMLILDIIKNGGVFTIAALEKITETTILNEISSQHKYEHIRKAAKDRLKLLNNKT